MRVNSITVIANDEEIFDLSLRMPDPTEKFFAKAVLGLDAEELNPKFYGFGLQGGLKFYDFSLPPREVVMRVVLNPNYKLNERYSDLRDELLRAIASNRTGELTLILKNGAISVSQIKGQVTKFEVPHFSKVPELQLTIKCEDAIFRGVTTTKHTAADLALPGAIILGTNGRRVTDAVSTAPHGCLMKFTFTAPTPTFIIQDKVTAPNWQFSVSPSGGFLNGDVLHVSSEYMNRYVNIVRGGSTLTQANRVAAGSLWPLLFPGANEFYTNISTGFTWTEVSHKTAYWGV